MTEKQGSLKQDIRAPETKEIEPSQIKNQSPPAIKATPLALEQKGGKKLAQKFPVCEEEIEIWLDDDQDLSAEALAALVQQAMESKEGASKPSHPAQALKEAEMEAGLSQTADPACPSFGLPVKKKRMQPPVGKRTKSAKKKHRS